MKSWILILSIVVMVFVYFLQSLFLDVSKSLAVIINFWIYHLEAFP